jgi:TRAP-type C4-dicarboxylate transport system substrate-binding protein
MKAHKVLVLCLALAILLTFAPSISSAEKPILLRFSHFMQDNRLLNAEHFLADEVYKRTNGRVKIELYWGGTLGKRIEMLDLLKSGSLDMGGISHGDFPSQLPLWHVTNAIPFLMKKAETVKQVAKRIPQELPAVRAEFDSHNIKYLNYSQPVLNYVMFSTKPVRTFEDLKGLKVRTYGVYLPQAMKVAGAVGLTMYPAETYENLKRGVVDASIWNPAGGYFMKNYEVAPHVCLWDIQSIVGFGHFCNMDVWNKLPADVQQIILQVEEDNFKIEYARCVELDKEALAKMKADGATIHAIPDSERQKWVDACPNFLDQWMANCEKVGKGDEAKQMKDLWLKIIKEYDK